VAEPTHDPAPALKSNTIAAPIDLARAWDSLIEKLEGQSGKLRVMKPVGIDAAGVLAVSHPASYHWAVKSIRQGGGQNEIEQTLSGLLGRRVSVQFEVDASAPPPPERPRAVASPEAGRLSIEDPLVAKLIEAFEAKTLRVEVDPDSAGPIPEEN
jgi:hypothetical protein